MTDQEAIERTEFALRRIAPEVKRFQEASAILTSCMGPKDDVLRNLCTQAVERLEQLERAVRDTRETINKIARETLQ